MDLRRDGGNGGTDWQVNATHDDGTDIFDKPYQSESQKPADIKVVLLGAPGVGKTAIAQQFVSGTFQSSYYPTAKKETYYPSVIHHDRKYNLKVVDIPDIPFLQVSSYYNPSDMKAYGLRDANAYILVFDLLSPDSFDYIAGMFSQINESRDLGKVPVVVVGNKTDKVNDNIYKSRMKSRRDSDERRDFWERDSHGGGHNGGHHGFGGDHHDGHENGYGGFGGGSHGHYDQGFGHFGGGGSSGFGGHHHHDFFGSSKKKHKKDKHRKRDYGLGESSLTSSSHHDRYGHGSGKHGKRHTYEINWANTYTPDDFLDKDMADKVTNEWKVMYKECSAKDPEAVTDLFKSVMGVFEDHGVMRVEDDDRGYDYERPKACVIL